MAVNSRRSSLMMCRSWSYSYLLRLPRGISMTTSISRADLVAHRQIMAQYPRSMEFRRINGMPPYVFTIIDGLKIEARRAGQDVIDLGFGNPDIPSPEIAVEKLAEAAHNTRNHRYSASRGIPKLRQAVADLYKRRFDVRPRPRHRGDLHHRRQGGLQPPDVGAARPRRRVHGAVAVVPDPHLGPAVRRRRGARGADDHRRQRRGPAPRADHRTCSSTRGRARR